MYWWTIMLNQSHWVIAYGYKNIWCQHTCKHVFAVFKIIILASCVTQFGLWEKSSLCLFSRKFDSSVLSLEYVCVPLPYPTYPNEFIFLGILHWNTYQTGDPDGMFDEIGNATYFYPFVFQVEGVLSLPASVRPSVGLSLNFTLSAQ